LRATGRVEENPDMSNTLYAIVATVVLAAAWLSVGCSQPDAKSPAKPTVSPLSSHDSASAETKPQRPVPPYHESADAAKPFSRLMPAARYRSSRVIARTYEIAHQIPGVLVQQPCYCYCDKFGHASLLDCYASDHGAG
jgi:hypothetical protein